MCIRDRLSLRGARECDGEQCGGERVAHDHEIRVGATIERHGPYARMVTMHHMVTNLHTVQRLLNSSPLRLRAPLDRVGRLDRRSDRSIGPAVSYTHLRAHETD